MRFLDPSSLSRAVEYVQTRARPLERALYAHRFEAAPAEPVLEALASFANPDGGFGRALEPDVRTPSSSALATAIALRTLREIDCPTGHPLARRAIDWLFATLNPETLTWRVVASDTNDHPHAPWWHDADGGLTRTFDDYRVIPRALAVASLHHFGQHLPAAWREEVALSTIRYIESLGVVGSGGGSDLEYVAELARTPELPDELRTRLDVVLRTSIPQVISRDPAEWSTYCITPLRAAPRPDAVGADLIEDDVRRHLDFMIDQQAKSGAWEPSWTFTYPPAMGSARDAWCGILTLETLRTLSAHGRLHV